MLVVVSSLLLTLYLIFPEAIFRTIFGWFVPSKSFVLSKLDTAYRALAIIALPFVLALAGSWYAPIMQTFPFPVNGNSAVLRRTDYKIVASALYDEHEFEGSKAEFWPALTRCSRRQGRLVFWYLFFIIIEAIAAGKLAKNYARYKGNTVYRVIADKFLFSYISEWHPLLTPYLYVDPKTSVQADILCTNDTLYQGTVSQYTARNGQLTGIFLKNPKRFNRDSYLKAKVEGKMADKKDYWQPIPSQNMYFFVEKIVNMNLSYITPTGPVVASAAIVKLVEQLFSNLIDPKKITITQEKKPPESKH